MQGRRQVSAVASDPTDRPTESLAHPCAERNLTTAPAPSRTDHQLLQAHADGSAHLDMAVRGQTTVQRYANTALGIVQLLRTLCPASVLALESTGHWRRRAATARNLRALTSRC